ncbi:MAG: pantetheine-phosphate adenylyltransferase [Candidatus Adiutrix sp.]|jgi:pantetheine-phosphate adenylyltransferase|nr:pantetheine-phosphate adenylyltransferase [Candidatus Adiutrix sp.]
MPRIAVYPGSFDPPTLGHLSVLERGLHLFDRVIVAVARNSEKKSLFTTQERMEMLRESLAGLDPRQVEVDSFDGLLVDYARSRKATALLRGLRATADFEYEFQMAMVNRHMEGGLQSVFLMTEYQWLYISSSIVREIASYGADVRAMVPAPVADRLEKKFAGRP